MPLCSPALALNIKSVQDLYASPLIQSTGQSVRWDGWLLYTHESTQVGAGMSYVRGAVHTEEGELIASFAQDALIRPLRTSDTSIREQSRL